MEEDNSAVRNLQYIQASMIWLDVCSFCGFKRKMEIAESNLQPLVTVSLEQLAVKPPVDMSGSPPVQQIRKLQLRYSGPLAR